jgi:hypothetical protein
MSWKARNCEKWLTSISGKTVLVSLSVFKKNGANLYWLNHFISMNKQGQIGGLLEAPFGENITAIIKLRQAIFFRSTLVEAFPPFRAFVLGIEVISARRTVLTDSGVVKTCEISRSSTTTN